MLPSKGIVPGPLPAIPLPPVPSGMSPSSYSRIAFHGMLLPGNKATSGIKYSAHIPWGQELTCSESSDGSR